MILEPVDILESFPMIKKQNANNLIIDFNVYYIPR